MTKDIEELVYSAGVMPDKHILIKEESIRDIPKMEFLQFEKLGIQAILFEMKSMGYKPANITELLIYKSQRSDYDMEVCMPLASLFGEYGFVPMIKQYLPVMTKFFSYPTKKYDLAINHARLDDFKSDSRCFFPAFKIV